MQRQRPAQPLPLRCDGCKQAHFVARSFFLPISGWHRKRARKRAIPGSVRGCFGSWQDEQPKPCPGGTPGAEQSPPAHRPARRSAAPTLPWSLPAASAPGSPTAASLASFFSSSFPHWSVMYAFTSPPNFSEEQLGKSRCRAGGECRSGNPE